MTGQNLIDAMEHMPSQLLEEAQALRLCRPTVRHRSRRVWLIAAAAAAVLILAGCVACVLTLRHYSMGKEPYLQKFDESGLAVPPRQREYDLISNRGHQGDPIYEAQKEWMEYTAGLTPGSNVADDPDIPNNFEYIYGCHTPDMLEKAREILGKYQLKPLTWDLTVQRWQEDAFWEAVGFDSFLRPDAQAELGAVAGTCYLPGNFDMESEVILDDHTYPLSYQYGDKRYFPPNWQLLMDLDRFEQWEYTSGGTPVLLALDAGRGIGYIFADRGSDMIVLHLMDGLPPLEPGTAEMDKATLESLADLFDFTRIPREMELEPMTQRLEQLQQAKDRQEAAFLQTSGGFAEVVRGLAGFHTADFQYTFRDITGDGKDELLILHDNTIARWYDEEDGTVWEHYAGGLSLCEGNVLTSQVEDPEAGTGWWYFYEPTLDRAQSDTCGRLICLIRKIPGDWRIRRGSEESPESSIPARDAQAIIAEYPIVPLTGEPLTGYPLDAQGYTLGQYLLDIDVQPSPEELREGYLDVVRRLEGNHYTHYGFADVNGDGVEDLLLSGDGEIYWSAYTHRFGKLITLFWMDFTLCDDGVLCNVSTVYMPDGSMQERRRYLTVGENGQDQQVLAEVFYDRATATWHLEPDGPAVPREEAQAILDRSPEADQGMLPLSRAKAP